MPRGLRLGLGLSNRAGGGGSTPPAPSASGFIVDGGTASLTTNDLADGGSASTTTNDLIGGELAA